MFCIICDSQRLMAKFEELFVYLTNTAKQRFLIAGTTSLWRNSIIAINLWNQRQIYKVWINSSDCWQYIVIIGILLQCSSFKWIPENCTSAGLKLMIDNGKNCLLHCHLVLRLVDSFVIMKNTSLRKKYLLCECTSVLASKK